MSPYGKSLAGLGFCFKFKFSGSLSNQQLLRESLRNYKEFGLRGCCFHTTHGFNHRTKLPLSGSATGQDHHPCVAPVVTQKN